MLLSSNKIIPPHISQYYITHDSQKTGRTCFQATFKQEHFDRRVVLMLLSD